MTMASHAAPVVVIGHTGFVGSAIARSLASAGVPLIPLSSRECNLLHQDAPRVLQALMPEGAQVVFCSGIIRTVRDTYDTMLENIRMVHAFAHAARTCRLASLVYLSTTDVYGHFPPVPITELTPVEPDSYYGIAKLAGERLLRLGGGIGCPVSVLRLPGVYGPGDGDRSVVGRLVGQLRRDGAVTIYGNGRVRRDYVAVGDVCAVVGALLGQPFDGTLNLASGRSVTIEELVHLIAREVRLAPSIRSAPAEPHRAGDQVFDVTLLRKCVPSLRLTPIEEGLAGYLNQGPPARNLTTA